MDDEEEDMSPQRPVSQRWGAPFREIKIPDTDAADRQDRSTQTSTGSSVPRSEGQNTVGPPGTINHTVPYGRRGHLQARTPFGNAGFRSHFPAEFEPMDDRGEGQNWEEEDEAQGRREEDQEEERRRMEERQEEEQVEDSVEERIGRKLREIGDQFHEDHVQLFLQHQRDLLPVWMRLTMALYGFLFRRETPVAPRRRGQER
ncbi:BCL2 modifying factor 2 [Esox lucius]|uniref:BCL2 modifying factor 2 n=1 Tax=Esox lucius TaxID=8010 RepID=UPI0005763EC4|nr:BCL2 modifying factor 2 [Esox lucius]XP_019911694.1 BCL2 modifying factor 2 [Esox lucius]